MAEECNIRNIIIVVHPRFGAAMDGFSNKLGRMDRFSKRQRWRGLQTMLGWHEGAIGIASLGFGAFSCESQRFTDCEGYGDMLLDEIQT